MLSSFSDGKLSRTIRMRDTLHKFHFLLLHSDPSGVRSKVDEAATNDSLINWENVDGDKEESSRQGEPPGFVRLNHAPNSKGS